MINSDLTIGANITVASSLMANEGLSCNGMMLAGQGFLVDRATAQHLVKSDGGDGDTSEVIRPHIGGSEITKRRLDSYVIDFFGLTEAEARRRYPTAYQQILETVRPERETNRRDAFRRDGGYSGNRAVRSDLRSRD